MAADVRWCPHCKLKGEKKRKRLLQINDSLAVLLCENEKCVSLGETVSTSSSLILQRKSSEIPNSKRKKCRLTSSADTASKVTNTNTNQRQTTNTPESSSPATSKTANSSSVLLRRTVSSETMPRVTLWRNKSALCWLDACMCILVCSQSLRDCLVKLPETSLVRTLCVKFLDAQKKLVTDDLRTCQDQGTGSQAEVKRESRDPAGEDTGTLQKNSSDTSTTTCPDNSPKLLDKVRQEVFQRLQLFLKCDVGQDDSPVIALPLLLRHDGSIEEHFMTRYRWEFYCTACGHAQVNVNAKTVLTLVKVPADFSMSSPSMVHSCPHCGALGQRSLLVFHSLPACVMLHFQDGLSDGELAKHQSFLYGKDTYTLSAVVQYRRNPDHFVTHVRDSKTNCWLQYDDILPSPYAWQSQSSLIPASEIHIMVWERLGTPCTACESMQNDVNSIHDEPVITAGAFSSVENVEAVSQAGQVPLWNENSKSSRTGISLTSSSVFKMWKPDVLTDIHAVGCGSEKPDEVFDLTVDSELIRNPTADPASEDVNKVTVESIKNTNGIGKDTSTVQEASRPSAGGLFARSCFLGFGQGASTIAAEPATQTLVAEPSLQSSKNKLQSQMQSAPVKPVHKKLKEDPAFTNKVTSQQKVNKDSSSKSKPKPSSVLGRIPEQLLNSTGIRRISSGCRTGHKDHSSDNRSILNKIPKQLHSGSQNRQTVLPKCNAQPQGKGTRPIIVGSSSRVSTKLAKFQPYGHSSENPRPQLMQKTCQEHKDDAATSQNARNNGTLRSWQKRVGIYSTAGTFPNQQARRDSADDNTRFTDLPKHAGHPCSSVSSPSACSDISSLSDNLSCASGKTDLTATIDELCKVLDISSEYTPSMSSQISSPSQDMFLSELMADESMWAGLEEKLNNNQAQGSLTTNSSSVPSVSPGTSSSSLTHGGGQDAISMGCFQATPTGTPTLVESNAAPIAPLQETPPSTGQSWPGLVPLGCTASSDKPAQPQSSMPPSCDRLVPTVDTVARQQGSDFSLQAAGHVTSMNDHMLGSSDLHSLYDSNPNAGILSASVFNESNQTSTDAIKDTDITDPCLFHDIPDIHDIHDIHDVMEHDWKDNLLELLAQ